MPVPLGSRASSPSGWTQVRPGQRLWLKTKWLNREESVFIGWTEPEGSRPYIGALLLGYYDPDGRLIYAGRVGSGMGYRFSVPTVIGQCW
jgi:ATP-dependent DNA ligase